MTRLQLSGCPAIVTELEPFFMQDMGIGTLKARLALRNADPLVLQEALTWASRKQIGAQLNAAAQQASIRQAEANAERQAYDERIGQYNSMLSSMGGTTMPYSYSMGLSPMGMAIPTDLFVSGLIEEVVSELAPCRGDPPAQAAASEIAEAYLLGKVPSKQALRSFSRLPAEQTELLMSMLDLVPEELLNMDILRGLWRQQAAMALPPDRVEPLLQLLQSPESAGASPGTSPKLLPPPPPFSSNLPLISLLLAVGSWVGPTLLLSIPAVIVGHKALAEARSSGVSPGGRELAVIGLGLGYLNIAVSVLAVLGVLGMMILFSL